MDLNKKHKVGKDNLPIHRSKIHPPINLRVIIHL